MTITLAAGHLAFGDVDLQYLAAGDIIRRSTYMLAGQAAAVRVTGDPEGHDGLYYLYSDHLGSASAMTYGLDGNGDPHPQAGQLVGDVTRYYPFGGYREGSGPNEVTDRGYTGHKHNDDLGLIYMNARFYVSYISSSQSEIK
ncbi:MAG: hypothetical protein IPM39_03975 [Chloroflexi bacterium]|nr:hypothetical protein [Chloroflexota bacterium]